MSAVHYDVSSNFHPYECDGSGKCVHCDRRITYVGQATGRRPTPNTVRDWEIEHDPATCALCDPEYDMQPNPLWARAEGDNQ